MFIDSKTLLTKYYKTLKTKLLLICLLRKCDYVLINYLYESLVLCLQAINDETVHNLALQALGIFCTLDLQIAKEKFFMFCFQISVISYNNLQIYLNDQSSYYKNKQISWVIDLYYYIKSLFSSYKM